MKWVPRVTTLLLLCAGMTGAVSAAECRQPQEAHSQERAIVASVLNLDEVRTGQLVEALDITSALIPSRQFYLGLANWYRGYQSQSRDARARGIKQLRTALDRLTHRYDTDQSIDNRLSLGVASGHVARILFGNRQYLDGYNLAMTARELIDGYLLEASPDHSGYPDAILLKGLFEIYTYDMGNRGAWFTASLSYRGSRSTGIAYIENAIRNSAVFELEAVRALLGEVTWQTPAFCGYTGLIDNVGQQLVNNSDIAVLRQGLLLKCGYAERALEVNNEYRATVPMQSPMQDQLRQARLRIHASLGNMDWLTAIKPEPELHYHHQLALANAYDVAGQRQSALQIYRQLSGDSSVDGRIRSVSRVRQRFPFQPPAVVNVDQFHENLPDGCDVNTPHVPTTPVPE